MKTLFKMFWIFFKIGLFTIGGGYAMIPMIQREIVDKQGWIDDESIMDVFAVAQSTPGVIAVNSSIFVGYRVAGVPGAVAATAGVIMPSFIIILAVYYYLRGFQSNEYVQRLFRGIRSASVAMIIMAGIRLFRKMMANPVNVILAAAAFILIVLLDVSIVYTVLCGALFGIAYGFMKRGGKNDA